MPKSLFHRLRYLLDTLFSQPLTPTYWLWVVGLLTIGFVLLQPSHRLPDVARDLAIGGVMLGLARLFDSPLGRWAWVGFMALLLVLLGLDVALTILA